MTDVYNDLDAEQENEARAIMSLDSARAKAELDQQIVTAKTYGRSYKKFMDKCMSLATATEDVAAGMMYSLPRGGKPIEGPSARMAEIIQHAWGNNQSGQRPVDVDDENVTAEGIFYDLETNVRITVQVKRRITDKEGRRFNADMIGVTMNAASSIAHRNAVLKGVPKSFWHPIYLAARKVAVGDIKTLAGKRADAISYVTKTGVTEAQIFAALGVSGIEDIDLDKLATLRAAVESVKAGELTIDEAFPAVQDVKAPTTKGKPETKKPKKKTAAKKAKKPLLVDQITSIRDKLKEEGVNENAVFAKLEVGGFDEIEAVDYKSLLELIDKLSAAGAK